MRYVSCRETNTTCRHTLLKPLHNERSLIIGQVRTAYNMLVIQVQHIEMHASILSRLLPALLDEIYRVAATIWVIPWIKETAEGWMQIAAILNQWVNNYSNF